MDVDREKVVDLLRAKGEHDKAVTADCALPKHIDPEQDAGLLHSLDVSVRELTGNE